MKTKKDRIIIIVSIAITAVLIGLVVFGIMRGNREAPEIPSDSTGEETTSIPDIPAILPNDGEEGDKPYRPGEAVIDVVKENEKHEKPNEPTIEGEPFIGDGHKEDMNEENK